MRRKLDSIFTLDSADTKGGNSLWGGRGCMSMRTSGCEDSTSAILFPSSRLEPSWREIWLISLLRLETSQKIDDFSGLAEWSIESDLLWSCYCHSVPIGVQKGESIGENERKRAKLVRDAFETASRFVAAAAVVVVVCLAPGLDFRLDLGST